MQYNDGERRLYMLVKIETYFDGKWWCARGIGEDIFTNLNVDVNVTGGGYVSQTNAARTAIATAISKWASKNRPSLKLRNQIIAYDRNLIVGDSRRKEIKKSNAKGARARRQKSYR